MKWYWKIAIAVLVLVLAGVGAQINKQDLIRGDDYIHVSGLKYWLFLKKFGFGPEYNNRKFVFERSAVPVFNGLQFVDDENNILAASVFTKKGKDFTFKVYFNDKYLQDMEEKGKRKYSINQFLLYSICQSNNIQKDSNCIKGINEKLNGKDNDWLLPFEWGKSRISFNINLVSTAEAACSGSFNCGTLQYNPNTGKDICQTTSTHSCSSTGACPDGCSSGCMTGGCTYSGSGPTPTGGGTGGDNTTNCRIQGLKGIYNRSTGSYSTSGVAVNQRINGESAGSSIYELKGGTKPVGVSSTTPSGYTTGYTICRNSVGCHSGSNPTTGTSVTVPCDQGGTFDLWWYYWQTPAQCIIQGYKVVDPGLSPVSPASGQTITLDGSRTTSGEPYNFVVDAGSHTVSAPSISGYQTRYNYCYNGSGCNNNSTTAGNSVTVNCPANGYTDLWWHYVRTSGPTVTPVPTTRPTATPRPIPTNTPRQGYPTNTPPPTPRTPTRTPTPRPGTTSVPTLRPTARPTARPTPTPIVPGVVRGRIFLQNTSSTRATKCSGCSYGSSTCNNAPAVNKSVTVSGYSSATTRSCDSSGPYYSVSALPGSRTVTLSSGSETTTWRCTGTGCSSGSSGSGRSVTVRVAGAATTVVDFYVRAPECTVTLNQSGTFCPTRGGTPTTRASVSAPGGAGTNRISVQTSRTSSQSWSTQFTVNSTSGSGEVNISSGGSYYVTCNAYNTSSGAQSTGNPWCNNCAGWMDAGDGAAKTISVATLPPDPLTVTVHDMINWIQVRWRDVSGEDGYNVYRRPSSGSTYTKLNASPLPANTISYDDHTAQCGIDYAYKVTALDNGNPYACAEGDGEIGIGRCILYFPWFGARGSDVVGATGRISSTIPSSQYLIDKEGTGTSGVAVAPNFSGISSSNVSQNRWLADLSSDMSELVAKNENSYASLRDRFLVKVSSTVSVSGTLSGNELANRIDGAPASAKTNGIAILRSTGNLTLSGPMDIGSRKAVILVDGSVNIRSTNANGRAINLTNDSGFLGVFAGGNIVVDTSVGEPTPHTDIRTASYTPHMEGIFYADGTFATETEGNDTDRQLRIDGSVIGMQTVSFQRDLNGPYPAEYVAFRPDLSLVLHELGLRKKIVQELINP